MNDISKIVMRMHKEPNNLRFSELQKVCEHYFGEPRQNRSSHLVFKMPWAGDPRVNIQNDSGKSKSYQVRQVLRAIEKLEKTHEQ